MATRTDHRRDSVKDHSPFQAAELPDWERILPRWLIDRPQRFNLPAPLTLLVLAAVIGAALLSPYIARDENFTLAVVALVAAPVGLLILTRWPMLGIWALPPVALYLPFSIGTGSQTGINAAVLLLALVFGLWLAEMLVINHRVTLLPYPAIKASLVFCVVAIVAFGFGQFRWYPADPAPMRAQIGGLGIYLLSALTIILIAHRIRSMRELEWLIWIFLICGAVYVVIRNVPQLYLALYRNMIRQAVQGVVFYIWIVSLGLAQIMLNVHLHRIWKLAIAAMLLGLAYLNLYISSAWVSGWLPPLVAAGVVFLLAKPRFTVLGVIGFGVVAIMFSGSVFGVFSEGDNAYSTMTRLEAWKILWEIIKNNPLFGVGMANYYFYTPFYSILGYNVSFNSHNNYIDIVAQSGFLGLITFLGIFWTLFRQGWGMYKTLPEGRERAYVVGALGGLAGTFAAGFLGDWVVPFVYNIGLNGFRASLFAFLFLGGMLAVARMAAEKGSIVSGEQA